MNGKPTAVILATTLLALVAYAVVAKGETGAEPYRYESFDPAWAGQGNHLTTPPCHPVAFSFGYSPTRHAGGKARGEIGGTLYRSTSVLASYGVPIAPATYDTPLSASGRLRVPDVSGGGAQFGFYSAGGSTQWRTSNALMLRVDADSAGWRLGSETGSTNYLAVGGGFLPAGGRFPYSKSVAWTMTYDPATSTVTATVGDDTSSYVIPAEMRTDGASFDRFGIVSVQVEYPGPIRVYLDDVKVNGRSFAFGSDPGWDGVNNTASFTDCAVHGRQDFGVTSTGNASGHPGEVGGTIWRGTKAWTADTVSPLGQNDTLHAEGILRLTQATSDADAYLGWFNEATTWAGSIVARDAVFAAIGSPSRVGFRFTPAFLSSAGAAARADFSGSAQYALPLLNARGSSRRFELCYQSGTLTASLDADPEHNIPAASSVVQVPASTVAGGLSVNRFGVFVGQDGGHSVGLWLDDVRYTTEPGDTC